MCVCVSVSALAPPRRRHGYAAEASGLRRDDAAEVFEEVSQQLRHSDAAEASRFRCRDAAEQPRRHRGCGIGVALLPAPPPSPPPKNQVSRNLRVTKNVLRVTNTGGQWPFVQDLRSSCAVVVETLRRSRGDAVVNPWRRRGRIQK